MRTCFVLGCCWFPTMEDRLVLREGNNYIINFKYIFNLILFFKSHSDSFLFITWVIEVEILWKGLYVKEIIKASISDCSRLREKMCLLFQHRISEDYFAAVNKLQKPYCLSYEIPILIGLHLGVSLWFLAFLLQGHKSLTGFLFINVRIANQTSL